MNAVKVAAVVVAGIIVAAWLVMYMSPYHSCVRAVTGAPITNGGKTTYMQPAGAARVCARSLAGR